MKSKRIFLFCLLVLGLTFGWSSAVSAQEPKPTPDDNQVNAVAKQLYCPVCENIPLDVCPTQACAEWRELIRQKLALGWSTAQIKEYFALQYGDRVLAEPPRRGLNWLVYVLPGVLFLGGVFLLAWVLRGMRRTPARSTDNPAPTAAAAEMSVPKDEYLMRVEEELKKFDKGE